MIKALFAVWDSLAERRALPEELYVVELGVGNGSQARTWLDAFRELDAEHGHRYYRRLHYLMGDYSPHVLELARAAVADHAQHVSSLVLDAQRPMTALGFLRFKVFLVYISNVYDNLPTDEIATIGQRDHLVQTRAYLDEADAVAIADGRGGHPGRARRPHRQAAAARSDPARRGGARAHPGPGRRCRVLARVLVGPAAAGTLRAALRPRHLRDRPGDQRRAAPPA